MEVLDLLSESLHPGKHQVAERSDEVDGLVFGLEDDLMSDVKVQQLLVCLLQHELGVHHLCDEPRVASEHPDELTDA